MSEERPGRGVRDAARAAARLGNAKHNAGEVEEGIRLGDGCYVVDLGDGARAIVEGGNQAEDLARARRLKAVWRACQGISTKLLEAALEEDLILDGHPGPERWKVRR